MAENDEKAGAKPALPEISFLNVIFCLMVVFVHVSSEPVTSLDRGSMQYLVVMVPWRLSTFAMQGFLLLSGAKLFLGTKKRSYGTFLLGRFVKIFVPYVVWVCVYYLYFYSHGYFELSFSRLLRYIFLGNITSPFYFIIIIFQFYLLMPFWNRFFRFTDPSVVIAFTLLITIILGQNFPDILLRFFGVQGFRFNDRVFTTYLVYWAAGCCIGINYESFKKTLASCRYLIIITFFVSALTDVFLCYKVLARGEVILWAENVHILYCLSVIMMCFLLALRITGRSEGKGFLPGLVGRINRVSYGAFLIHCLVIALVGEFMAEFGGINMGLRYVIRIVLVFGITFGSLFLWDGGRRMLSSRLIWKRRG